MSTPHLTKSYLFRLSPVAFGKFVVFRGRYVTYGSLQGTDFCRQNATVTVATIVNVRRPTIFLFASKRQLFHLASSDAPDPENYNEHYLKCRYITLPVGRWNLVVKIFLYNRSTLQLCPVLLNFITECQQ